MHSNQKIYNKQAVVYTINEAAIDYSNPDYYAFYFFVSVERGKEKHKKLLKNDWKSGKL